jgi:hypothetical protein
VKHLLQVIVISGATSSEKVNLQLHRDQQPLHVLQITLVVMGVVGLEGEIEMEEEIILGMEVVVVLAEVVGIEILVEEVIVLEVVAVTEDVMKFQILVLQGSLAHQVQVGMVVIQLLSNHLSLVLDLLLKK